MFLDKIISATNEYQHWGLNALTISFLISIFLTIVAGWGLVQQNKSLWRERTAEAVSVIWLAYYGVLQLAIFVYGLSINSAALLINGLLALLYIPLLIGLGKFKGFTTVEVIAMASFIAAITAMILLPYKPYFFLAFAVVGLLTALTQPLEMWRKKSARGLNIRLIGTILFGNVVWFTYGLAIADWVLITINAIAFLIFGTTALLWRSYRRPDATYVQATEHL